MHQLHNSITLSLGLGTTAFFPSVANALWSYIIFPSTIFGKSAVKIMSLVDMIVLCPCVTITRWLIKNIKDVHTSLELRREKVPENANHLLSQVLFSNTTNLLRWARDASDKLAEQYSRQVSLKERAPCPQQ